MTVLGVDYAWTHPDPGALAAAGYRFACRYLSHDASKNLTLAEAKALAAHGVWVVANWEYGAQDMLRGRAGGVADAQAALAQATAAGMPAGRPVYFSADWDVTPAQEAAVSAYLAGVNSVLGVTRTGEYAGFYPVRIARDSGLAAWSWQTSGWSGGQWDPRDQIRQTGSATVGGVQVDVNEAMVADYGQWMPGVSPSPPPAPVPAPVSSEEDMFYIISVAGSAEIYALSGGRLWHIADPADLLVWEKTPNVVKVTVSQAELASMQGAGGVPVVLDAAAAKALAHALAVELHNDTPAV